MDQKTACKLTRVQIIILAFLNLHGGQLTSLNHLAERAEINYSWAWVLVRRMETEGMVAINRSGRDLVISLSYPSDKQNDPVEPG